MSLRIRRCYVQLLAIVFDYATRIKKDKEIVIEQQPSVTDPLIDQEEDWNIVETSTRKTRPSDTNDIRFNLGKRIS